jgi:hypothetical protein
LIDGAVQVHLALLHHGRVETLKFTPAELEEFAQELEMELQTMDRYEASGVASGGPDTLVWHL